MTNTHDRTLGRVVQGGDLKLRGNVDLAILTVIVVVPRKDRERFRNEEDKWGA